MKTSLYRGPLAFLHRATDNLAGVFSPAWQAQRLAARAQSGVLLGYDAAQSKRTRRASRSAGSADSDLLPDLATMRNNARTMVRDDANAAALLRVLVENVVGTGMVPQSMVVASKETGFTESQAQEWNDEAESIFADWAEDEADATEHTDFAGLQQQVLRELVRDGEVLSHRLAVTGGRPRKILSAIETIDVDRLVNPNDQAARDIRGGVELGARSQALAYWITPRHPSDPLARMAPDRMRKNLPERWAKTENGYLSILHTFDRSRSGQHRGVPMFSSCFGLIEALNDIVESEMVASRAASKICMLVSQTTTPSMLAGIGDQQDNGEWHETLEAGTIKYLNSGEKAEPFVPNRPGVTWEAFVQRVLRSICSSFGLPYEMVARDWAAMSYSGMRGALNEAHRGFEQWQQMLARGFLAHWWRVVITEAVERGVLRRPVGWDTNRKAYLRHVWIPPSWGYVDPTKEIQAEHDAIENNLTTPQAAAQRQGGDSESNLRQRARHIVQARKMEEANNLPPGSLHPLPGAQPGQQPAAAPPAAADKPAADGQDAEDNAKPKPKPKQ